MKLKKNKTMKINIYLALILLLFMSVTGCKKDLLDITPLDKINPDDFFKNAKEAEIALNGVYNAVEGPWDVRISFDAMSDDLYDQYPWEGPTDIGRGNHGPTTSYMRWKWSNDYRGIARANLFIANMEVAEFESDIKDRMIAEAKFMRAYLYADLVDFYEDVPLVLEPQELADANIAKSPKATILTAIYKDLDEAAPDLPNGYSGGDIGRATKGAAYAIKARVKLYNGEWADAATAAKQVMDLPGYGLYSDYEGLFSVAAENNEEIIFDIQYMKDKKSSGYSTVIRNWRSFVPLVNLTNDYYMANGLPITDGGSGYDITNPFDGRDPRMYATLQLPGKITNGEVYIPKNDFSPSGMALNKWVEWGNNEYWNSEVNIIVMRYADVLLMYAEAQNENVGSDASVYAAINEVRDRAGMPDVLAGLSKDQMREEIRHERRIEFVAEGLRYSDIRRWRIAEDVMTDGIGYNRHKLEDPSDPTKWVYEEIVTDARTFDASKHYVWPIPQVEIETNSDLVQHTAWQ